MRRDHADGTVTPEAVQLRADIAGVGSRSIALIVDMLIQVVLLLPVLFVALGDGIGGMGEAIAITVIGFVVLWLYFPAFEWLWRGQTPGKRLQGIRVVRTSGQPAGMAPVVVRNLVRIVDAFLLPFLALFSMVVTKRGQRLGDLAAGTMVVRERRLSRPQVVATGIQETQSAAMLDTSAMSERDYTVLRTFLARRSSLDATARAQLAERLAARLREQVGQRSDAAAVTNEQLIELAAQSYRARFANRPG